MRIDESVLEMFSNQIQFLHLTYLLFLTQEEFTGTQSKVHEITGSPYKDQLTKLLERKVPPRRVLLECPGQETLYRKHSRSKKEHRPTNDMIHHLTNRLVMILPS
ncbi:hypothetical protein AVEN_164672-1 [Araneus ventricosus]|uniref:Uncharacterized protein n=1 Tax=Araneus ventricosus TaxID=182803 RepID=A0A4Y2X8F9_ARAVE|nr:hypothetical protein AVEN_164672-1 [Araneus ventricosus]